MAEEYSIEVKQVKYGKYVTIISFHNGITEKEMKIIAKQLKKRLGTGGTVKNGSIIIQGRHSRLEKILLSVLANIHNYS